MKEAIVGSVLMKGGGDEAVDMAMDGKIRIEGVREVTAVRRSPEFVVHVAQCASECLDTVACFPFAETSEEFEEDEGEGIGGTNGGVGEKAVLDEGDVVAAAGLGHDEVTVTVCRPPTKISVKGRDMQRAISTYDVDSTYRRPDMPRPEARG